MKRTGVQAARGAWCRPRSWPVRGRPLVSDGVDRLRLWDGLSVWLAVRAFALACRRVAGGLADAARADGLAAHGFGLRIVVASPEVAAELSLLGPALLAEVNFELSKIAGPKRRGRRTQIRPLRKLLFRVRSAAQLAALPAHAEWLTPRAAPLQRATRAADRDMAVVESLEQVKDPALQALLASLYEAATAAPARNPLPRFRDATDAAPPVNESRLRSETPRRDAGEPVRLFAVADSVLASIGVSGMGAP